MNSAKTTHSSIYRLFLTFSGGALLLISLLWRQPLDGTLLPAAIEALSVAFLVIFPIQLLGRNATLVQIIILGMGLIYGPTLSLWSGAIGTALGIIVHHQFILPRRRFNHASWQKPLWEQVGVPFGRHALSLGISSLVFQWFQGIHHQPALLSTSIAQIIFLSLIFAGIHMGLFLLGVPKNLPNTDDQARRNKFALFALEFLPVPFVLLALHTYPTLQLATLVGLTGIPAMLAVLMYTTDSVQQRLERRIQDISTLNIISSTVQFTLDAESVFTVIQQQVTEQLGVDSFYVALYNRDENQIWYPLAVKHGERRDWPPRAIADRLTDRVIIHREPILIARQAREELSQIGLPPGEEALSAWLGVPLNTTTKTLGCLAILSPNPEIEFTEDNKNLLTIIAGQISVVLDNALLFEQSKNRANQLEKLNQISSLLTSSLDLDDVLTQVCQSITQVVAGLHRSAIYLLDPDGSTVTLAHSLGLSPNFISAYQTFSVATGIQTRCLRTGQPILIEDLNTNEIEKITTRLLLKEGIHAYGDFPLITSEGGIGYLSVYFNTPHTFRDEEAEILQTFASQAALAVSNARLHGQTDTALNKRARQLSILEAVGRELSAVIHSDRLFEMIVKYAREFTSCPWGCIVLYDPETDLMEIKASHGYVLENFKYPTDAGITGQAIRLKETFNIGDTSKSENYLDMTSSKSRSQLSVPLIHKGRVLGALTLESPDTDAFSYNDQSFITQLATQAAIAVINADLYQEAQRRLREQSSLYRSSRSLVGDLELDSVLKTVAKGIRTTLEASVTAVYLWDEKLDTYSLKSTSKATTERHNLIRRIAGGQLRSNYPTMQITDTLRLYQTELELQTHLSICENCQAFILPLTIGGEHLGVVVSHLPKGKQLSEENKQLPRVIAAQGSIALHNALLFNDVIIGKDHLEAVLASVADGVMMVDNNGIITLVNPPIEMLIEKTTVELLETTFIDLPDTAFKTLGYTQEQAKDAVQKLKSRTVPDTKKAVVHITSKGPEKVLECTTSPVWGHNERLQGLIIVTHDITEEHEINQARELITHTIVHDLRSPMGAIVSALYLINELTADPERDEIINQSLDIAKRSTKRVLGLINELLDISKMQSGKMDFQMEKTSLATIVNPIVKNFSQQASTVGVIVWAKIPSDLPPVMLDLSKMTRVLTNLVDNALKFSPSGGQIVVSAEQQDEAIVVAVSDNGPGIPDDYHEWIFDQFSQVPGSEGRHRGSGLGLTFCRLAVEGHNGGIWVDTNPEGSGSIFKFTLPIHQNNQ